MTRNPDQPLTSTPLSPPQTSHPSLPGEITTYNETHRFFSSHPYTAPLLHQPKQHIFLPGSRHPKSSTEDSLIALTLRTPNTISHILALHPLPSRSTPHIDSCTTLLAFGSDLNGFPHILHGGIVATALDEAFGVLLAADADRRHLLAVGEGKKEGEVSEGEGLFTTRLDVRFLAPVETPGVVRIVVEVVGRKGRWVGLRGRVLQGKAGGEVCCATGEAEFVSPKIGGSKL